MKMFVTCPIEWIESAPLGLLRLDLNRLGYKDVEGGTVAGEPWALMRDGNGHFAYVGKLHADWRSRVLESIEEVAKRQGRTAVEWLLDNRDDA